jgi:ClpP class serine protease
MATKGKAKESRRQPTQQPPVLFEKTQAILAQLEAALKQPIVTYWNSTNGSICSNDVVGLYAILQSVGRVDRLSLFIKSDGGFGEASLRMVNLLRQYAGQLTAIVPLECTSAATMLALGADRILMGPLAQLSAVDTIFRRLIATMIGFESVRMSCSASFAFGKARRQRTLRILISRCSLISIRL